jgi:hypothetical protein
MCFQSGVTKFGKRSAIYLGMIDAWRPQAIPRCHFYIASNQAMAI